MGWGAFLSQVMGRGGRWRPCFYAEPYSRQARLQLAPVSPTVLGPPFLLAKLSASPFFWEAEALNYAITYKLLSTCLPSTALLLHLSSQGLSLTARMSDACCLQVFRCLHFLWTYTQQWVIGSEGYWLGFFRRTQSIKYVSIGSYARGSYCVDFQD